MDAPTHDHSITRGQNSATSLACLASGCALTAEHQYTRMQPRAFYYQQVFIDFGACVALMLALCVCVNGHSVAPGPFVVPPYQPILYTNLWSCSNGHTHIADCTV
ncbi:TPA: hypothetical protein ACH3X1_004438 [Trebouxia sp. C0004]